MTFSLFFGVWKLTNGGQSRAELLVRLRKVDAETNEWEAGWPATSAAICGGAKTPDVELLGPLQIRTAVVGPVG